MIWDIIFLGTWRDVERPMGYRVRHRRISHFWWRSPSKSLRRHQQHVRVIQRENSVLQDDEQEVEDTMLELVTPFTERMKDAEVRKALNHPSAEKAEEVVCVEACSLQETRVERGDTPVKTDTRTSSTRTNICVSSTNKKGSSVPNREENRIVFAHFPKESTCQFRI